MDQEEMKYKQELIDAHRRRMHGLQMQGARQGINTDPAIIHEVEDITKIVQALEKEIVDSGRMARLVFLCKHITNYANIALRANQDALLPFFLDHSQRPESYQKMKHLYQDQENVPTFGSWEASLQSYLQGETSEQIKEDLQELQSQVELIKQAFYSPHYYDNKTHNKYSIVRALDPNSGVESANVDTMANEYLTSLRQSVNRIGHITEKLQLFAQ